MKIFLTILFFFVLGHGVVQGQIILRPGLGAGYGFNAIRDKMSAENSFHSPKPGFSLALNGRIEGYLNKHNSVDFAIKGTEAAFSFSFALPGVFNYEHQTSVEFTQYNLGYNHYLSALTILKKISSSQIKILPKIGFALGASNNQKESYYQMYLTNKYFGVASSLVSYSRLYTVTPEKKIGFYLTARAGISIFRKSKELFDLVLEYNKGVSDMANLDLQYSINGTSYRTLLVSKGTNINITGSIPITLYRKK